MLSGANSPGMVLATYLPMLLWFIGGVVVLVYLLRLFKRMVVALERVAEAIDRSTAS